MFTVSVEDMIRNQVPRLQVQSTYHSITLPLNQFLFSSSLHTPICMCTLLKKKTSIVPQFLLNKSPNSLAQGHLKYGLNLLLLPYVASDICFLCEHGHIN